MIEASHLRIGNYIGHPVAERGYPFVVVRISLDDIGASTFLCPIDEREFLALKHWEPIPLTPEWLERLGIEYKDDNPKQKPWYEGDILFTIAGHEFSNSGKNGVYSYGLNNGKMVYQFVHELQNLYFALTGEELTVKA